MPTINKNIEDLLFYAKNNLYLSYEDSFYARNQLLELFNVNYSFELADNVDLCSEILKPMIDYAINNNIIDQEACILLESKIMGLVTPSPGLIIEKYNEILSNSGTKKATEFLYLLAIKSNYIRMNDIKKNISWMTKGEKGTVGITINLAKPEKDPKKIVAELKQNTKEKYPQCPLCLENLGYAGNLQQAGRQTLRYVPITLNGKSWHLQYSPYVYYDEHCIAFSDKHTPMKITEDTFARLIDFVSQYPHYFIGSNADLPIVGGSILSHDHYQGGKKVLPMLYQPLTQNAKRVDDVTIGIRDWYCSVIHISSKNKYKLIDVANKVLKKWQAYSNPELNIQNYTNAVHNTITPIASKNSHDDYCLDLILRNNRTDDNHPYGIFHPSEDMHNIKKEGIGLIEAMGLFILPGRLKKEIQAIINILSTPTIDFESLNNHPDLSKHLCMIVQLANDLGTNAPKKQARDAVISYINKTCINILECVAVFKRDIKAQKAFDDFLLSIIP